MTRSKSSKVVYVYRTSDKNRDPVTYYEKYCRLLAPTCSSKKLYSRCKKFHTPSQWYCDQPLGINKIKTAVKEMCKQAGVQGKFTNHSLRATAATRMYDNQVPEQIIKETTGHKSDCVCVYKRTSDKLCQKASSTLAANPQISNNGDCKFEDFGVVKSESHVSGEPGQLSYEQMCENVVKTKLEIRKKMFPKSRLKLRKSRNLVKSSKRQLVTIDLNVNVNQPKKAKKIKIEKKD